MQKQRETIFSDTLIEKINPPKHQTKRNMDTISNVTGIDFLKKKEVSAPTVRHRPTSAFTRNTAVSDQENIKRLSPQRKARGTYFRDFNQQSQAINAHGFEISKKHYNHRPDNMKFQQVTKPDLSILKHNLPERQQRVSRYMNSNQMKDLFNQSDSKYYRGLLG